MNELVGVMGKLKVVADQLDRSVGGWQKMLASAYKLMHEQADEIDRLRLENKLLNTAIELYRANIETYRRLFPMQ